MTAFPLSPVPSWFGSAAWTTSGQKRNGIHHPGDTVTVKLSKAGATGYTVRDYYGNVVSSGSIDGVSTSITIAQPTNGWKLGWYRAYFTGPNTDTLFGNAYAVTNFVFVPNDSRFLPTPDGTVSGRTSGFANDFVMKGVLGAGTSRLSLDTSDSTTLTGALSDASLAASYWTNPGSQYLDPGRTRYLWCNFAGGNTWDELTLPSTSGDLLHVYCKDGTIDGSKVFVSLAAGSTSGSKIQVCYPNATTVVETYDNQATKAAAATAINAASAYIKAFVGTGTDSPGALAATAIGNTNFNTVKSYVSQMYAVGVSYFEGPANEPSLSDPELPHKMRLFQAAVKAGNASAKAIGPCCVDLSSGWSSFLSAGGHNYCDEISTHAYSADGHGDLNMMRHALDSWVAMLAQYGAQNLPRWQTESTASYFTAVYGVHHPRNGRIAMLQTLVLEEYGFVREKNNPWYDQSHGFWSFAAWLENGDGSVMPQAVMYRTLAAETWGQTYQSRLTFPSVADNIFAGWLYSSASAQVCVLMTTSDLPGATVTLSTNAVGPLTVVDAFGNTSTVAVTNGMAAISVSDVPTYLRFPVGATCSVSGVNDWQAGLVDVANDAALRMNGYLNGIYAHQLTAGSYLTAMPGYSGGTSGCARSSTVPGTIEIDWITPVKAKRMLIWAGPAYQDYNTLLTFTVDASYDGINWSQVGSYDVSPGANSFQFGSDASNTGCKFETFWPAQFVFDVPLTLAQAAQKLRVNVTLTSYGGEPDVQTGTVSNQGQGWSQELVLQRVAVLGTKTPTVSARTIQRA